MPGKADVSKKKSQPLKRSTKRKMADEEMALSENEVRNTHKKNKSQRKRLSSQETGQTSHTNLKKVTISSKKRKTWQPLSQSSRQYLQTLLESVIIAILSKNVREKEQIQYHLNCLKKRFLQQCESLTAPPQKLNVWTNESGALKMECVQCRSSEDLALVQEEIDKLVQTTESVTRDIQSLTNKIQILTTEVEEEEKKLKERHQISSSGDLALPELSQKSLKALLLQKELLTLIPNKNALLKDLTVLHNSPKTTNLLTFIEEAYKRLDTS